MDVRVNSNRHDGVKANISGVKIGGRRGSR